MNGHIKKLLLYKMNASAANHGNATFWIGRENRLFLRMSSEILSKVTLPFWRCVTNVLTTSLLLLLPTITGLCVILHLHGPI